MRAQRLGGLAALVVGCAIPGFEHDPRAVAPHYDRWEARVPAPPDSVYTTALTAVLEAGYTVALASRADHVITTNLRHLWAGSGLETATYNLRFTLSVLPLGADSARLSVTGDTCSGDDLAECRAVTAYDGQSTGSWQFVRRLGESVRDRMAPAPATEDE